jgi:hypothetical protein
MTPAQWNEYERQAQVIERHQKWKEQQKQAEISDEEIEKEASKIHGVGYYAFSEGAKWYREQLKKIESVTNCNQFTTK